VLYQLSYTPVVHAAYFVSRCSVCCRQRGQNLFSSSRPGSFRLFFRVLYVRSLQVVHARAITGRFSALATWFDSSSVDPTPATLNQGRGAGGSSAILCRERHPVNERALAVRPICLADHSAPMGPDPRAMIPPDGINLRQRTCSGAL